MYLTTYFFIISFEARLLAILMNQKYQTHLPQLNMLYKATDYMKTIGQVRVLPAHKRFRTTETLYKV